MTNKELYIVEYTCLTMAAQFEDCKVPDESCEKFKINLDNGVYQVFVTQYYNADQNSRIGGEGRDIDFAFVKQNGSGISNRNKGVFWFPGK